METGPQGRWRTAEDSLEERAVGIVLEGNCRSRCWLARREPCRCTCQGRNHGAMQPGSRKLQGTEEGHDLQTIMSFGIITEPAPGATDAKKEEGEMTETTRSKAQWALEIQDKSGEAAMLAYVIRNRASAERQTMLQWEEKFYTLDDGTAVAVTLDGSSYRFYLSDGIQMRPIQGGGLPMPPHPGRNEPLLDWPSADSLSRQVARVLEEQEARKILGEENAEHVDEPLMDEYRRLSAVPDLQDIVRDFIRNRWKSNEDLLDALDEAEREGALRIIQEMDDSKLQALRETAHGLVAEEMGG